MNNLGTRLLHQPIETSNSGLPEYVVVEGVRFDIILDNDIVGVDGEAGRISMLQGKIRISSQYSLVAQWSILLHELIHGVGNGLDLKEQQVEILSDRLFGVLIQNQMCFACLTANPPAQGSNANPPSCQCQKYSDNSTCTTRTG